MKTKKIYFFIFFLCFLFFSKSGYNQQDYNLEKLLSKEIISQNKDYLKLKKICQT